MKNILIISLALMILTSCEKELDFHYHDIEPQLVIEGTVSGEGAAVALTMTTPMDEPMNHTRLIDATITLQDITDGTTVSLIPNSDGVFTSGEAGIEGHEYRLEVTRGDRCYSAVSQMAEGVSLTGLEFQWIKMPYDYVAVLQVSFTDPDPAGNYYWVRLTRNSEAYMWSVLDDSQAVNGVINEVIMTTRKDLDEEDENTILRDGDLVGVSVTPISQQMADYLIALQSDSNGPRMFDGDFCLGYFLAAPVSASQIVFHPDKMQEYK